MVYLLFHIYNNYTFITTHLQLSTLWMALIKMDMLCVN